MGLELTKVQEYKIDPATNMARLIRKKPYIRLVRGGETPIICQGGRYYSDGGDNIHKKDVPSWFWADAAKASPEHRKACGLVLPEKNSKKVKESDKLKQEDNADGSN